jgi:hypothetical protein
MWHEWLVRVCCICHVARVVSIVRRTVLAVACGPAVSPGAGIAVRTGTACKIRMHGYAQGQARRYKLRQAQGKITKVVECCPQRSLQVRIVKQLCESDDCMQRSTAVGQHQHQRRVSRSQPVLHHGAGPPAFSRIQPRLRPQSRVAHTLEICAALSHLVMPVE